MIQRGKLDTIVHTRIEEDLLAELRSECASLGYRTLSPYLRLIISRRNLRTMKKADLPQGAITAIEHLASEVKRIGVLYNQFVAAYNKAILLTDRDGNPVDAFPDANNHGIDAVRYALNRVWQRKGM